MQIKESSMGGMDICFRTAHYMYIVVRVYFSHMPVIFAGDLAAVRISEVSIIAYCLQGES